MELLAEGGTQDWVGPDAIDQSMSGSADQMDAEAAHGACDLQIAAGLRHRAIEAVTRLDEVE